MVGPQAKQFLRRLKMELDNDEDEADAKPQPSEATAQQSKVAGPTFKEKKKAGREELEADGERSARENHGEDEQQNGGRASGDDAPRPQSVRSGGRNHHHHELARLTSDHGKRSREKVAAAVLNNRGKDGVRCRRRQDETEDAAPVQLKRPRAKWEKEDGGQQEVSKATVDAAKAKAAALRQRRMRKIQARRKATGELDRLTAIKLKRHESSEALRLKRNQREQLRKTKTPSTVVEADTNVEDKPRPRPPPLSREDAKERKRMLERQRRAAIKAKKELAVAVAISSVQTLKRPLSADSDKEKRRRRNGELRQAFGASAPVVNGLSRLKRHKPHREKEKPNDTDSGNQTTVVTSRLHISPFRCSSNVGMNQPTGKSEVVDTTEANVERDAKQKDPGNLTLSSNGRKKVVVKVRSVGISSPHDISEMQNLPEKQEQSALNDEAYRSTILKVEIKEEGQVYSPVPSGSVPAEPVKVQVPNGAVYRSTSLKVEVEEEGQVNCPVPAGSVPAELMKVQDAGGKKINGEKNDFLLDMMPIPRKTTRDAPVAVQAASFVIPKRSVGTTRPRPVPVGLHSDRKAIVPVPAKSLLSPASSPQLSNRDLLPSQRKRTKYPVPMKKVLFSAHDRTLLRLARKRNSVFLAAGELAAQPPSDDKKMPISRMMGYEVYDVIGKALPDLIPRLTCATKREMAADKDLFSASFFGVSLSSPKAKGKTSSTVEECTGGETEVQEINCYEALRFERPEDREFYQGRMYGTTFVPQQLRGRITLIVRCARFERKSTGIRFNQDRDREEFAASLSKRYTFNKSVPRCDIPRENWQKLTRNQPGTVYLHYYNRDDAERASRVFRDDFGNPLELKLDYKAGVVIRQIYSPVAGNWNPRRSRSNERRGPEPSPQSGSSRNPPRWQRGRQRSTNGDYQYSSYDWHPPTQRNGDGDRYVRNKYPDTLMEIRSRSRSRSRSASKAGTGTGKEAAVSEVTSSLSSEQPNHDMAPSIHEDFSAVKQTPCGATQSTSGSARCQGNGNAHEIAGLSEASSSPRAVVSTTAPGKITLEQEIGSDEEEQEEGEIDSSSMPVMETTDWGDGRGEIQRDRSLPRCWQQPTYAPDQRQDSYRDDSRDPVCGPARDYRSYEQQCCRGPERRRSRSRSRPRPRPEGFESRSRSGRGNSWDDSYATERRRSRDFGLDTYENNGRGRHMHSVDMYGGRDYRDEGYNSRSGDAYSRPY